MAIDIQYVVMRAGQEKMAFASKKDADAYDKMLDLAEVLGALLQQGPQQLDEAQGETLAMWLAENKDRLLSVLKSGRLPDIEAQPAAPLLADEAEDARPQGKVNEYPGRKPDHGATVSLGA